MHGRTETLCGSGADRYRRPRASVRRVATLLCGLLLATVLGLGFAPAVLAANPDPVQYYYVPFTEDQLLTAFDAVNTAAVTPITNYITITAVASGTLIYYDQWENGYDIDTANPANLYSSTNTGGTQIWGDGDTANGTCPGTTSDLITAGMVIGLNNAVAVPRVPTTILYDGRDKIGASKTIAVTRSSWAGGSNTLLAGSVEVFDLYAWGTDYRAPVGTDIPDATDYQMFSYTALSIMAGMDGATVQIDAHGDGTFETTLALAEGETTFVTDVWAGGRIVSDNPVQVDIFTGDVYSNYESRDSALIPTGTWSSDYYTPVSTVSSAQGNTGTDTTVWLFNSGTSSITVNYKRWVSGTMTTGTIAVGAGTYAKQVLTDGTGAEFYTSNGATFYAFSTTDSNNATTGTQGGQTGQYTGNQAWDWGFSLIPKGRLSTQLLIGLGIGRDPTSPTSPYENGNPVWVTPSINNDTASATVYVDYDGDPLTGSNLDALGHHYDASYSLRNLERVRIYRGGVQVDADSSSAVNNSNTLSFSHTTGPTADLMLVGVTIGNGTTNATVSSVYYGTQLLTPIATVAPTAGTTGRPRTALYALANPTVGTANVTVTISANRPFTAGATTFSGADVSGGVTAALRTAATATGTGATMSVSPTSVIGDGVYEVVGVGNNSNTPNAPTVGTGQLRRWTQSAQGTTMRIRGASSTTSASATTTTMTETQNGGPYRWSMIGVAIIPISTVMDQSGMLIYTLDPNTKLAGAWGQDPLTSNASAPGLDVGTSVPPMPEISAGKDATLDTDNDDDGYLSPGDVIEYSIMVYNVSRLPVPDVVIYDTIPTGTTYVAGSTYVGTTHIDDDTAGDETAPDTTFPLDGNGYNVGTIAYGESYTATFKVTVVDYISLGGATRIDNNGTGAALNVIIPVKERSYVRARLGNYVWLDANADGIQDLGERPVPGITVRLLNSTGTAPILDDQNNPVTAVTDANGEYDFKGLYAGSYMVEFDLPTAYELEFTPQDQGTDDAVDSDPDTTTGMTSVIALGGGQWLVTADAGVHPTSPTLAVVGSFEASVAYGKVVLSWVTASETDTAGFYVERLIKETNVWVRVNRDIVPALFESPTGGSYSLVDGGAQPNKALTYRIVELELSGDFRTYGPYNVTAQGVLPQGEVSEEIARGEKTVRIPKTPMPDESSPLDLLTGPVTGRSAAANRLRVEVVLSGLYRIEVADIVTGLGVTEARARDLIAKKGLQLTSQGSPVAYLQAPDNSAIYFYGQAIDSIYTATNVYWLTLGKGTTMTSAAEVTAEGDAATSFVERLHVEQDLFTSTALFHDPKGDFWLWSYMSGGSSSIGSTTVDLDAPDALNGIQLDVQLQGLTTIGLTNEHHVRVWLNGTLLGETSWTGAVAHEAGFSIPAGLLLAGANQVQLEALRDGGIAYSMVALDSLDLIYERSTNAVADQLTLSAPAVGPLRVGGLSSADARVFDLANPLLPQLVAITASGDDSGAAWVTFNAAQEREYLVATAAGALRPQAMTGVTATTLRAAKQGADYVVITAPALAGAAARLAAYRASQGLKTAVVTTTEIYDEFSFGIATPEAIRSFIAYMTTKWKPVPRYVVLAGEGSFDYKNYTGYGDSLVPPLMIDTENGLVPSDVLLADNKGDDGVPEVAIGRIPVLTEAELDSARAKIKAYEADARGTWRQSVVLAADNPDIGGDFSSCSDAIAAVLPSSLQVTKVYMSVLAPAEARAALLEGLADGALLVNYVGHAGVSQLAQEGLLTTVDVAALAGTGSRLPIVTALTCVAGQYGLPGFDGLSEALVKRADAGAIAVWSPTALEENDDSILLGTLFAQKLFGSSHTVVLGNAILAAAKAGAREGLPVSLLRTYNLLGDPALRVQW
jgi:uncharacterized repeat protein (TIGR01451 family)